MRTGLVVVGAICALATTSTPASSATLCQKVTPAMVSRALGVKVTKVTSTANGNVTVCWFQVGKNVQAVYVRTQTHDSVGGYRADLNAAKTQQQNPKADSAFKPYPSFSTAIGSATYGFTFSVTVLKRPTELAVGASDVTLAKVEGLAKIVLSRM